VGDSLKLATKIIIGLAIAPFIASIIFLLVNKFEKKEIADADRWQRAIRSTVVGLLYLFVAVAYFLIGIK
jgi:hypothetical protein